MRVLQGGKGEGKLSLYIKDGIVWVTIVQKRVRKTHLDEEEGEGHLLRYLKPSTEGRREKEKGGKRSTNPEE